MSSVTSQMAQVGRKINYFICIADLSGAEYDVSQNTANYNSWNVGLAATQITTTTSTILQDMGEMAKVNGQILRKVRLVDSQAEATGNLNAVVFWIVVPGGEYPIQGSAGSTLTVARVARLG